MLAHCSQKGRQSLDSLWLEQNPCRSVIHTELGVCRGCLGAGPRRDPPTVWWSLCEPAGPGEASQDRLERRYGQTDRHLDLLVTLLLSSPASTLGMPHGAATFMGTCSGDKMDCVSEVSVPEILEGKRTLASAGWGGRGKTGSARSQRTDRPQRTRSWTAQSGPVILCLCVLSPS